jgi:hypothetical protein
VSTATDIAPVTPAEAEAVEQVSETLEIARTLTVNTPRDAEIAVEFLARVAQERKRNTSLRRSLVDPMNERVKAINDRFKSNEAPLLEADELVRARLLSYTQQEEQRLAEEQKRIDAERVERERLAEEERQRELAAAAEAERAEREREQARQAELREAANERAREIAMLDDHELEQLYQSGTDRELVDAEQKSRRDAREAQERAEKARRQAEEATQASIAVQSAPAAVAAPTKLTSAGGNASVRKEWRATAIDRSKLPDEYLIVDEARINQEVKAGTREIPGVTIELVSGLAVRAR